MALRFHDIAGRVIEKFANEVISAKVNLSGIYKGLEISFDLEADFGASSKNRSSVLPLMSTYIFEISVKIEPDKRNIKRLKIGNVTHFWNEIILGMYLITDKSLSEESIMERCKVTIGM